MKAFSLSSVAVYLLFFMGASLQAAPSTPTNLSPGSTRSPGPSLDAGSVTLRWNSVSGSSIVYDFGVRDMTTGVLIVDRTTLGTSFKVSNLVSGHEYRWNIRACDSSGCSSFSPRMYFQTDEDSSALPPRTPSGLNPGNSGSPGPTVSSSNVRLSWNTSEGATVYDLGVRDLATNDLITDEITSNTSYRVYGLQQGRRYRWNVRACNEYGCSNFSSLRYFQTESAPYPDTPTNLSPGEVSQPYPLLFSDKVVLTWASAENAIDYDLRVTDLTDNSIILSTTTNSTSIAPRGLTNGRQYAWRVRSCNDSGCSSYSPQFHFETTNPQVYVRNAEIDLSEYLVDSDNQDERYKFIWRRSSSGDLAAYFSPLTLKSGDKLILNVQFLEDQRITIVNSNDTVLKYFGGEGIFLSLEGTVSDDFLPSGINYSLELIDPHGDSIDSASFWRNLECTVRGSCNLQYYALTNSTVSFAGFVVTFEFNDIAQPGSGISPQFETYGIDQFHVVAGGIELLSGPSTISPPPSPEPGPGGEEIPEPPDDGGHNNLVIVTHGWVPLGIGTPEWPNTMANNIEEYISSNNIEGSWTVIPRIWKEDASTLTPTNAYTAARGVGYDIANQLLCSSYDNIHLLGHSAGSNLIQSIVKLLDAKYRVDPTLCPDHRPSFHLTFFDAFYPYSPENVDYGSGQSVRWAEQFVDFRQIGDSTDIVLPYAYNFEVSGLDDSDDPVDNPSYAEGHAWPWRWYDCTIPTSDSEEECLFQQYGFPVSLAYDPSTSLPKHVGWGAEEYFPKGDLCTLTRDSDPKCGVRPIIFSSTDSPEVSLDSVDTTFGLSIETSETGTVEGGMGTAGSTPVYLTTGSPVWVNNLFESSESFNAIKFDYEFLTRVPGILSIHIDGETKLSLRSEHMLAGLDSQEPIEIGEHEAGQHVLSIRLDPLTREQVVVAIANLKVGTLIIERTETTAASLMQTLIEGVKSYALGRIENSLLAKLSSAIEAFDKGNLEAAKGKLKAFIEELEAQSGKKVSSEVALILIEAAADIRKDM